MLGWHLYTHWRRAALVLFLMAFLEYMLQVFPPTQLSLRKSAWGGALTNGTSSLRNRNKKNPASSHHHRHENATCFKELAQHMRGHWKQLQPSQLIVPSHISSTANNNTTSSSLLRTNNQSHDYYFPEELDWIQRQMLPNPICDKKSSIPRMFTARIGHQCGCRVSGFVPSVSEWVVERHSGAQVRPPPPASVQLVRRLNGSTLCFVGDSVDLQFYQALQNNLARLSRLQPEHQLVSVETNTIPIPVNDTTQPGGNRAWWGGLREILETDVRFFQQGGDGGRGRTRFRWYRHYVWSPWDVEFMQDDCNVIVMNIALHYDAQPPHVGRNMHSLVDDTRAAVTFLANYSSTVAGAANRGTRTAIWRSALPQHFNTTDGHYYTKLPAGNSCVHPKVPVKEQQYRKVHEQVFGEMCSLHDENNTLGFVYACDTKQTANHDYQTVYKWWSDNNYTTRMAAQHQIMQSSTINDDIVKGKILHWDVANLFDNPKWHTEDNDCTHFCYIPSLFEAAFERLEYLMRYND